MNEDRFMPYDLMLAVSRDLEAAGFKHVIAQHIIDPQRIGHLRPNRPTSHDVAWTMRVSVHLLPMDRLEALLVLCKKHGLTFWLGAASVDDDEEVELLVRLNMQPTL